MDNKRRNLIKSLTVLPLTALSIPLLSTVNNTFTNPTNKLFDMALKTWKKTEVISPATYIEKLQLNKENYKATQIREFAEGNILELDGLILSKSEVASLANIAIISQENS
jgi:hypothetical protein